MQHVAGQPAAKRWLVAMAASDAPANFDEVLWRVDLQAKLQKTMVFITHDFEEALRLADHIAIMKDGAFEQVGTAADILTHPATPYVEAFTRDAPKAKILTVASAMKSGEAPPDAPRIEQGTSLEDALPLLLSSAEPLQVVGPDGRPVGSLRREDVAELLGGQ